MRQVGQNLMIIYGLALILNLYSNRSITIELINAIKDYFESVLSTKLLYKFERMQLNEVF